jgi:hypothetical protein
MKFLLVVFLCLFFTFGVFAQTAETAEKSIVNVENIALMRDDGEGNPGNESDVFKTTDFPIHCQITLDSVKASGVKMNLVAVAVNGLKAETKIMTVSYKTNGEQNIVSFRGSPEKAWMPGKYRVDIFIDNRLAGNKEFTIEKSASSSAGQTNFTPPKPKAKTKPKRKN